MGGVGINDNKHCTGKKHRGVCILQDVVVLTLVVFDGPGMKVCTT